MLKIFSRLRSREWLMICISLAFVVAQVWLDLRVPEYMTEVTTIVTNPGGTIRDVLSVGGMMLICTLCSAATSVIVGFIGARVGAAFSHRLRGDVFRRVASFSMEEMNGFSTASLITRTTNDITQIQMIIAMGMQVAIKAPIMAVWALSKISTKNWEWTALTGGLVAVVILMIALLMTYALPKFRRIQTLTDNLNRVTRENLTGIRVVRAYNAEGFQEAKFEGANEDFTANSLSVSRAMQVMNPVMWTVMTGLPLGIFWIGAFLIDASPMAGKGEIFSNMVVFSQYAMHVVMSFMMLTMIFVMLPRVMVSVNRVNEVLDTEPKIVDKPASNGPGGYEIASDGPAAQVEALCEPTCEAPAPHVEFKNVSFIYPDAEDYVLRDVSFTAGRGETVAFIGSTGSGKSTLINLIPRFYDVTEGQVLVDGIDVRDMTQEALRNKLGYIPQRAVLFSGTVASNVAFGESGKPPANEDDIMSAIRVAQAEEFVRNMEGEIDAPIAQGGTNVSGGEKQRLAIARAVCRKPEIYIFDDSFSALDFRTDRALRSALRRETEGATNLIVAQRIGTIREADRIIVLDEGVLVGAGRHDELMESCEVYREIAYSQLSAAELGMSDVSIPVTKGGGGA